MDTIQEAGDFPQFLVCPCLRPQETAVGAVVYRGSMLCI